MARDYYLGLDIGTGSIGWAVTDEGYNLLRGKGHDLWGVHLFESADTAENRRLFRSSRRRQQRKVARLNILKDFFLDQITPIDKTFFDRLRDSKFFLEDKSVDEKYLIFADSNYTDKDFHRDFPTFYHLRKCLIEDTEKKYDIRLYYLAIHHILKNRGHFLFQGQSLSSVKQLKPVLDDLLFYLNDEYGKEYGYSSLEEVEKILTDKSINLTTKTRRLTALFFEVDDQLTAILGLISGRKIKFDKIFSDKSIDGEDNLSFSLSSDDLETKQADIEIILGEKIQLLYLAKSVYDYAILSEILLGEDLISNAKVRDYNKHKDDLVILKRCLRKLLSKEDYKEFFGSYSKEGNYASYVGMTVINKRKVNFGKKSTQEDLYKRIRSIIKPVIKINPDAEYIDSEIEKGTFLPKQRTKENVVIPYQLHGVELEIILNNASNHYPFLLEELDGYSTREKILKLFEFRIPYYVGPLNDSHKEENGMKGFSWIVKKEDVAIRPWNFDKVVDKDKTAELFIRRMTNNCTYISGEEVLPKNSLVYARYMVLNEINNIKINEEAISTDLKQRIYIDLFQKYKRVTAKRLRDYLKREHVIGKNDDEYKLSGFDGDFKSSLVAYHDFLSLGLFEICSEEELENIVLWLTVYNGEIEIIKRKIEQEIPQIPVDLVTRISKLRYRDWGRMSLRFLNGIEGVDTLGNTGEMFTILKGLWDTNFNLMELLGQRFTFSKILDELNQLEPTNGINYSMLDELYVSPAVKRMIWRTLRIADELKKVMGRDPKKIFIEMAREEERIKQRKSSRKQALIDLYKNCKEEERNWVAELEKVEERTFRQDRLYLYYTQRGRCMYSGEVITLSKLYDKNLYDIDHIYPQSKTKDNSLNNRVLVLRKYNVEKGDTYPLPFSWRSKMHPLWQQLKEEGLITPIKYSRLTRSSGLTQDELSQFIARQLVETRQSTKVVAEMLKSVFAESNIVYVKSRLTSDFRHDFDLLKVREINDFHHAHDAYLNIVTGNVYNTKFTDNPYRFISKNPIYTLNKLFNNDVKVGSKTVWEKEPMIKLIKTTLAKPSVLYTRMANEGKGQLFNATHIRASEIKKGTAYLPLRSKGPEKQIEKYGAYDNLSTAYFFAVEHLVKDKKTTTIEVVPLHYAAKIEEQPDLLERFAIEELGLIEPKVLVRRILMGTMVNLNGFFLHLAGKTGQRISVRLGTQLFVEPEMMQKMRKILTFSKKNAEYKGKLTVTELDEVTEEMCLEVYDYLVDKHLNQIFSKRPNSQGKALAEKRDEFIALTMEDKCSILERILILSYCVFGKADLKLLGLSSNTGVPTISKKVNGNKVFKLIHQSPTGLFREEVDLLKL
jgi:CRISPR-associated endonuclease Csn1